MRAAASGSDDATFSIRWLGFTKFGLLMLVAVVGTFALRRSIGSLAAVAFATCVVLVATDPAVLLHAHGFHAEFASFLFLLASIVAMSVAGSDAIPGTRAGIVAALAVLLFATSKVQHLADGFVLLALFGVACFLARRRDWLALLALTVASLLGLRAPAGVSRRASSRAGDSLAGRGLADVPRRCSAGAASEGLRPSRIADGLGLPASQFTWARVLDDAPPLEYALFVFGPAVLVLLRPCSACSAGARRERVCVARARVAAVPDDRRRIMLGGSDVDVAKQGFLVLACLLCFWVLFARHRHRVRRAPRRATRSAARSSARSTPRAHAAAPARSARKQRLQLRRIPPVPTAHVARKAASDSNPP